jgi:methylisocitrate lyase
MRKGATKMPKKTTVLRSSLAKNEILILPGTFNALVAQKIEQLGFEAVYCTGAGISTSYLGLPDIGLITLTEMTTIVKNISASVTLPVISDADTGFGNAINVMRTVREFEAAGVAAIHLEDQISSKKCGHVAGKGVIGREEMVGKIKAAIYARQDPDFVIIARTDSKNVEGFNSAVERAKAYRDAGADVIFPEALESAAEFEEFATAIPDVPLMANMTEFGKTPYFTAEEFRQMGYKIVNFPVSTMRVAMKAVEEFLIELKKTGTQKGFLEKMQTRKELYEVVKYARYTDWENKFLPNGGVDPLSCG